MNRSLRWFAFGAIVVFAIALAGMAAFVTSGRGFSAREQPGKIESWLVRQMRSAAVSSEARGLVNPLANTPEIQSEARAHWADHCAGCHANDGSGDTQLGKRTYPPSPDMRLEATQRMTDGELFFVIENGIRFTAMPGWGDASGSAPDHDAADSWKLVHFIRHLPQLTSEEKLQMQKLNPKSPDEVREELEEEKFLRGEENATQVQPHHH